MKLYVICSAAEELIARFFHIYRRELFLLHEPEHHRLRRHGTRFLSPSHPRRLEKRDGMVLLVLHNVRNGTDSDVLQHPPRRDRPSAESPAGQTGAGETKPIRGRAIDGPVCADLVTISVRQSVPQEWHR